MVQSLRGYAHLLQWVMHIRSKAF